MIGLVPLKSGEEVITRDKKRHFVVPKSGGVYYPKQASFNRETNDSRWMHYFEGVNAAVTVYNNGVDAHNELIKQGLIQKKPPQKRWWRLW